MNKLDQLKKMTTVVADTGDIDAISKYTPTDATTNPSLLLKAAQQEKYSPLIASAVAYATEHCDGEASRNQAMMDKLAVNFGVEILKIIPGRISTEVDARLSFNTEATIARAERIMSLYREQGIGHERVLIKIASTWEGIRAASYLEQKGIHCNLTLMFSLAQAIASAEAGVTLISPFVGRIMDWYKKIEGVDSYVPVEDPGVQSVTRIFNYFKKHGYDTVVMGASFRNTDEIEQLSGCDFLTIAPDLMEKLQQDEGELIKRLDTDIARSMNIEKLEMREPNFRWMMNEDAMATEKLAEGIRKFAADTVKLEQFVSRHFN